jgi:hypothetical protein
MQRALLKRILKVIIYTGDWHVCAENLEKKIFFEGFKCIV